MRQVFYRTPLTTDTINFESTNIIKSSDDKYVSHGIIPVYYPEVDSICIDFDDEEEQKKFQKTYMLEKKTKKLK